jgi:hypothetical protein
MGKAPLPAFTFKEEQMELASLKSGENRSPEKLNMQKNIEMSFLSHALYKVASACPVPRPGRDRGLALYSLEGIK